MEYPFNSEIPEILLVNAFNQPFADIIAAARTCYSSKVVKPEDILPEGLTPEELQKKIAFAQGLAGSIYEAGHHTTLQHTQFQFLLVGVSRQLVWSLLHAHPFYNSEQQSQRYVKVNPEAFVMPNLLGQPREIYEKTVEMQTETYLQLRKLLQPTVAEEYRKRFPKMHDEKAFNRQVLKKSQEVARYVLNIGAKTILHHTISFLTLLRYWRISTVSDVPSEAKYVIKQMKDAVLKADPKLEMFFEEPIEADEFAEPHLDFNFPETQSASAAKEFDAELAGRVSKLIDAPINPEAIVGKAFRSVWGISREQFSDRQAIELLFDNKFGRMGEETTNLSMHSKSMRILHNLNYTFMKKLSHSADSQDQRHRMTPASRPSAKAFVIDVPDYITPKLIAAVESAKELYADCMKQTWQAVNELLEHGVSRENAYYLLPNALTLRFVESFDMLAFRHKALMRLCYGAQEEIFEATVDETEQIMQHNEIIGNSLCAPCKARADRLQNLTPEDRKDFGKFCREGDRYCGVRVWDLDFENLRDTRGLI